MKLFDAVKQVSALEAAQAYGMKPDRNGRILCCFHADKNPSMKVYDSNRGFYCFSCHQSGTVVDLVAKYFGVTIQESALMIARDFGIQYDDDHFIPGQRIPEAKPRPKPPEQIFREKLQHYTKTELDYLLKLEKWITYGPRSPGEELNILFLEAVRNLDRVKYLAETLLQGDKYERALIIIRGEKELKEHEQRLQRTS